MKIHVSEPGEDIEHTMGLGSNFPKTQSHGPQDTMGHHST